MQQVIERVPCSCRVSFTPSELSFAASLANQIVAQKLKEIHHKQDHEKEVERWMTGLLGEMAVQDALHIDFMDYSVGFSKDYDKPDLEKAGFAVGIKTSCFPNFPVINRTIEYPQLIVILNSHKTQAVVAGLASLDLLKQNAFSKSNEMYVKYKAMLDRKNAFVDIDKLEIIRNKEDLGWRF